MEARPSLFGGSKGPVAQDALGLLRVVAFVTDHVFELDHQALIAKLFGLPCTLGVVLDGPPLCTEDRLQHYTVRFGRGNLPGSSGRLASPRDDLVGEGLGDEPANSSYPRRTW